MNPTALNTCKKYRRYVRANCYTYIQVQVIQKTIIISICIVSTAVPGRLPMPNSRWIVQRFGPTGQGEEAEV